MIFTQETGSDLIVNGTQGHPIKLDRERDSNQIRKLQVPILTLFLMPLAPYTSTARPVQTAVPPDTIWSRVTEDEFREHLVTLEKQTNAVLMDVLTAETDDEQQDSSSLSLPLKREKQVADDFAYIAAVTEGAQSVAAVCLEQHISTSLALNHPTLVILVAGMDILDEKVKEMLQAVVAELQSLSQAEATTEVIFQLIIQQHEQKLLGRLRSRKWTKPKHLARTHKKPLWQDFDNLLHRVQHVFAKKSERDVREAIGTSIGEIGNMFKDFEVSGTETAQSLQELVKATFVWCKSPLIGAYASRLETAGDTRQVAAAIKTLRQLEKIGAYWRIAQDLVAMAKQYKQVFQRIHLEYVTPYASIPTSIAYESWARTCHVHAEIQLVVELAKSASQQAANPSTVMVRPRTIGTSKYLCYLCYLFLRYHGEFQLLNSHGRLYDQWTVPDLAEYSTATRNKFAAVLESMDEHVVQQIKETQCIIWRPEPMTSRQNLLLLGAEPVVDTLEAGVDELSMS
ncbi:hypothetical protein AN5503.2 [Aspergillus nidulans FGSC A4]|uniref:Uncharacterized protein n=1 Tax=Emericella nidulans (strain FGSC A4 / ATCC 38163 / CBS 112.46 / NRRL 194 / M139) TaxID=227321 RepID=Q5B1S7_EMENI|nr:hypothetical protein [Aspergillus nidulans FGSC A4]EAA62663.1 hypothetical protein AN5503.2 [Aspergillus nidulans FGSC A4]CBF81785.1 TPA: conserved hypothetical protein [Aspergillus nidulans FGSC A4]|eukprot:XP_663107.1 hypothetical protein AN5503.2 [Aspergillus nidulans FGSC A4]